MRDITKYTEVVLSLERDANRRENFFSQLSALSSGNNPIDFDIFFAIDAKNKDNKIYIEKYFDFVKAQEIYGRKLSYGEAACSLSHIEIYKSLVKNKQTYSIICEDDAKFHPNYTVLKDILAYSEFDIVVFGESKAPSFSGSLMYRLSYPLQFKPKLFGRYKLGYIYDFYTPGTVGYAIRNDILQYVIKLTEKNKVFWLADDFQAISKQISIEYQYQMKIGHLFPRLVIEDLSLDSNLEKERASLQKELAPSPKFFLEKIKHNINFLKMYLMYFWKKFMAYRISRSLK